LYQFEPRLQHGDQQALVELAPYFDSHKIVLDFLGHHVLQVQEHSIARRLVKENSLFTDSEINLDSASSRQFLAFLTAHRSQLVFSPLATAFLLTPLDQRTATAQFRALTTTRKQEVEAHARDLLSQKWVKVSKVDSLVARQDPAALLVIAAELFKVRARFTQGSSHKEPYTDLLQLLTGTEIGVEDEKREISWHPEKDFYPSSQLNLLIYFATHYQQYSWNKQTQAFVNPVHAVARVGKEKDLFELLSSQTDSTALRAFTQLTNCNPATVSALANEQDKADISTNYALPTFPYRFLKQLTLLTEYCRANALDYTGSVALRQAIETLKVDLSFAQRYQLENKLINSLTLPESTALEYWTLVNENSFQFVHSSGRILDVFYSHHWPQLLASKPQLDCYLKKAALLERLGINGSCNNYLFKFTGAAPATVVLLKKYQTTDPDIQQQIARILAGSGTRPRPAAGPFESVANKDYVLVKLEDQLRALAPHNQASASQQDSLVSLLSKISYPQIGVALRFLEPVPFAEARKKYSFMYSDWGFFSLGDFQQKAERAKFLHLYARLSEYELYRYYLDQAGIDYQTANHQLDYDKLYERLKFDDCQALVGGGGATDQKEVYALIKLLELHFHTTLGFPHKFCNSANMYRRSLTEQTTIWLAYLAHHQLLKRPHNEPVSFSLD
jgi:hypothetical protein